MKLPLVSHLGGPSLSSSVILAVLAANQILYGTVTNMVEIFQTFRAAGP